MATREYDAYQRTGSEFGGVARTPNGIQPKPAEALTNGDKLRLGYLTGNDQNAMSLEDRRQMLGLRPANGRRPLWLRNVGVNGDPRLESVADIQQAWQAAIDEDAVRNAK